MVSRVFNKDSSIIASFIETCEGKISKISPTFEKKFGYQEAELLNKDVSEFLDKNLNFNKTPLDELDINLFKTEIKTKWGISKESIVVKAAIDYDRNIFIFKDSYRNEDLEHLQSSYIDKATGLQYLYSFNKELNAKESFYIVLFEMKDFTSISSYYGEDFANNLIMDLSNNLKNTFDINDIFKINLSSFAIIRNNRKCSSFDCFIDEIIDKVSQFNYQENDKCPINKFSYTFGFAEGNGLKIFKRAFLALNYCKENNLNKYVFNKDFHIKLKNTYMEDNKALRKLQIALERDKIVPFYQPIFCNNTNKITKYECLARLQDEDGSYLTPASFIDVARKFDLNSEITKGIIRKSFKYFENKDVDFSINLTHQTLNDIEMYLFIIEAVSNFPNPNRIIFEVIESEAMPLELFEKNNLIQELRKKGCKFALDDFGSGYSNLSMLTYFNYHYLKIDGSLIVNIHQKASYQTIKTIVELAHNHDVKVVAEWVKSDEIQELVKKLNIDYSQGFLFGKPEVQII
ncbi:EAL domain-containing protein [Aliarcobacter butzleri]|uniref:EAL domain-containing protein n=1 Tax=Aliarcobacter butzleri TaxID=28197 RepID=UPI00126A68FA|nr:EAL domain-containing protein [Aliarcobacter butzleri]